MNASLKKVITILSATLLIISYAGAQEADEQVYELSPFEIQSDSIRGYATTSSLGASRVAVPITELDQSVFTINENMIEDTVALELRDTLNFVSNANNVGGGGDAGPAFALRGYTTSAAQRDGLPSPGFGNQGGFNYGYIQRIEVIKGSAGVMYGSHSPGGILNLVSKMPTPEPMTKARGVFGSWNTYELMIDHSNFIDEDQKAGYRVSLVRGDTDGPMGYPNEPSGGLTIINPSFSYSISPNTKVWLWGNYIRDEMMRQQPTVYSFNDAQNRGTQLKRMAEEGKYSIQFDRGDQKYELDEYEIGLTHSANFGGVDLDARIVARMNDAFNDASRVRGIGTRQFLSADGRIGTDARNIDFADVDTELIRVTRRGVRYDFRPRESDGHNVTADLNWTFETGPVKHQLLTYATFGGSQVDSKDDLIDLRWVDSLPANTLNELGLAIDQNTGLGMIEVWPNPGGFNITKEVMQRLVDQDIADGDTDGNGNDREYTRIVTRNPVQSETDSYAFAIMERASFLEDRLHAVVGARRDNQDATTIVINDAGNAVSENDNSETTWKYGLIGKLFEDEENTVSVYYTDSETFIPTNNIDERLATFGQRFPNRIATLEEFGIKVDALDSRVVGTLAFFDTVETNFLEQFQDVDGSVTGLPDNAYSVPGPFRKVDGWEVDFAFNVVDGLDIIASYGDIDASLPDGNPAQTIPDKNYSLAVKYAVQSGALEGLSFLWSYNYWGESFQRGGGLGGGASSFVVDDGEIQNAVIGYRMDGWNFQLRVSNLWDDVVLRPSNFWTAVGVEPSRNFRFAVTRTW